MERGQDLGHQADAQRRGGAEAHAALVQAGKFLHLVADGVRVGEHALGQRKEGFAGVRQCDVAPGAVEKRGAEVRFERGNLPAERGLGQVEMRGGTREMADSGDFHETLELFQVHGQ